MCDNFAIETTKGRPILHLIFHSLGVSIIKLKQTLGFDYEKCSQKH